MKIDNSNEKFNKVTAKDGMWLFNGETFSDCIYTPKSADISAWREVTDDEKLQWEREHPVEEPPQE